MKEIVAVRMFGQAQPGCFPLPTAEARRLKTWLSFPAQFSALDPCVGDGATFTALLETSAARRYGIEIDAHRSAQATSRGLEVRHANTLDVHCATESLSLIYLNPPYDWEYGEGKNRRLEFVFLEHTYRWLKQEGVLVLVIPGRRSNLARGSWRSIFETSEFIASENRSAFVTNRPPSWPCVASDTTGCATPR